MKHALMTSNTCLIEQHLVSTMQGCARELRQRRTRSPITLTLPAADGQWKRVPDNTRWDICRKCRLITETYKNG